MAVEFLSSWCWPLSAWLSPAAAWFIFFNAVVGAIAVMSHGGAPAASRRRLCRSASSMVLDRLRSFSIFYVHPADGSATAPALDDGHVSGSHYYNYSQEAEPVCRAAPEPVKLTPLVAGGCVSGTAANTAPPSTPVATVAGDDDAASAPAPETEEDQAAEPEEGGKSISLDEAYALARQPCPQQSPSPPTFAIAAPEVAAAAARLRKRQPAVARAVGREAEEVDAKAELNARAELFIRQFREELKLQRLKSILNHTHALGSPTAAQ